MSLNLGIIASSRGTVSPAVSLLLDTYTGAATAYSLRKLRSAYTGAAIRVRRSSDNTETDIGFVSNVLDTTTLSTFCGVGNGFVTTWYDQSGNSRNLMSISSIYQPRIIISGVLQLFGTKPSIYWDGVSQNFQNNSFVISQPNTYFLPMQATANNTGTRVFIDSTTVAGSERNVIYKNSGGFYTIDAGNTLISTTPFTTIKTLLTGLFNTTASFLYLNSSAIISNSNAGARPMRGLQVGSYSPTELVLQGYIPEVIVYNSNQSTNRTAIESNINSYYSIY